MVSTHPSIVIGPRRLLLTLCLTVLGNERTSTDGIKSDCNGEAGGAEGTKTAEDPPHPPLNRGILDRGGICN